MEDIKTKKIGWIGLGAMGTPMAMNLLKAGYSMIVYNRTKSKEEKLTGAGAESASSPGEMAREADIIFLMVSDDAAVEAVFKGENSLFSANVPGKIFINMSTISPDLSIELGGLCNVKEHKYMDAPVSGSVKPAEEGSLVIISGAEKQLFDEMKPLLENLGKKVFHMGKIGKGNSAKLAVNLFLGILTHGLAEGVLFARKMGIKPADYLEVINAGGLSSPYTKIKSNLIVDNEYPPAFELRHMAKDLQLALDNQMDSPLGSVVYNTFQEAKVELGEKDLMAVFKYLERIF
ncbi:MAG: NAD(P)-dependent oxidoreductase [Bacteroidota bacterium]